MINEKLNGIEATEEVNEISNSVKVKILIAKKYSSATAEEEAEQIRIQKALEENATRINEWNSKEHSTMEYLGF